MKHDLKVGQKIFVVWSRNHNQNSFETITRVGRKWAYFGEGYAEYKVNLETLILDGGGYNSPGRVYANKEDYDREEYREDLWEKIRKKVSNQYSVPGTLADHDLKTLYLLLQVDAQ